MAVPIAFALVTLMNNLQEYRILISIILFSIAAVHNTYSRNKEPDGKLGILDPRRIYVYPVLCIYGYFIITADIQENIQDAIIVSTFIYYLVSNSHLNIININYSTLNALVTIAFLFFLPILFANATNNKAEHFLILVLCANFSLLTGLLIGKVIDKRHFPVSFIITFVALPLALFYFRYLFKPVLSADALTTVWCIATLCVMPLSTIIDAKFGNKYFI